MARELKLEGVQFVELRKVIDQKFADLHDSLEEAYYGTRGADGKFIRDTGWRHGVSKPWNGFDKGNNAVASKALFDQLHAAIWWKYQIAIGEENTRQGVPYEISTLDPDGRAAQATTLYNALPNNVKNKLNPLFV
jgi:hypothetical protein